MNAMTVYQVDEDDLGAIRLHVFVDAWFSNTEDQEAFIRLIEAAPDLLTALERSLRLFNEALPKFNWGASALDANAIKLLNEVPSEVSAAIAKAIPQAR